MAATARSRFGQTAAQVLVHHHCWAAIDDEAKGRLTTYLAARKLLDFAGPHGWEYSATDLGRIATIAGPSEGVAGAQRRVLPLVEVRAEFSISRLELDDADRGAIDLDLPELDEAAQQIAIGENVAVFHGYGAGGIEGITEHRTCADQARAGHVEISHCRGAGSGRPAAVGH